VIDKRWFSQHVTGRQLYLAPVKGLLTACYGCVNKVITGYDAVIFGCCGLERFAARDVGWQLPIFAKRKSSPKENQWLWHIRLLAVK
jgi:hypothetical protein